MLISIVSSSASIGDVRSIMLFVVIGLCFWLMDSINCTQALYSFFFSKKPISWIRDFRLGKSCVDFFGGESISNCFFPVALAICIVLIGMGLPCDIASVACLFLVDFLVAVAGGVCFWFCRFGVGEMSSSDLDDESSSFSGLLLFSCSILVWRLIPRGVCSFITGFSPVLFPVALFAFLYVGLLWLVLCAAFSCSVSLIGSPVLVSSLNIGCCGSFGLYMSKKCRHGPILRAHL